MTADDKKLLRKFINERADRARAKLQQIRDQKLSDAEKPLLLSKLNDPQRNAVGEFNSALQALADAMNKLVMLDLEPRQEQNRSYYYARDNSLPTYGGKTGVASELRPFDFDNPKAAIGYQALVIADRKKAIQRDYDEALKRLDATVNDALLDLLSKNLEGVRELLDKLSSKFENVAMVYEGDGTFE